MTDDELAVVDAFGVASAVSLRQSLAIVMALAERGAVDPLRVAAWAERLAAMHDGTAPGAPDLIAASLRSFVNVIHETIEAAAGGSMTRQ